MSGGPASLFELFGLGSPDDTAWMREGLCAQTDPELFFPEKGSNPLPAKRVCGVCPVRQRCRDFAMARPGLDGIWGATSVKERRQLRRSGSEAAA